jgi:hypothetical protein
MVLVKWFSSTDLIEESNRIGFSIHPFSPALFRAITDARQDECLAPKDIASFDINK